MPSQAIIISIGDEILFGQTLDTNAHWISGKLDSLGIQVARRITIGDRKEEILETLEKAEEVADIILITGGLGPTSDDLTKPSLVEYFDTTLVRHEEVIEHIETLFAARGRTMTELNKAQADIPANAEVVKNPLGTAPGMLFERNGKVMVSMPGVPYEMRRMMNETILPKIKEKYVQGGLLHRLIRTIGIPESKLASLIQEWEAQLPHDIKLAYLPTMGTVKLRLTGKATAEQKMRAAIQTEIDKVLPIIEKYVYGFDDEEIEEAIGRMLKERGITLSIAESCTGGYFAHKITSVSGSSSWFHGGMIPYSNELKHQQLEVPLEILEEHGAVSEEVVNLLAENIRKKFNTDIGVSVSGIAGPTGGTEEKPVGTVWIGYSDKSKTIAKKFQFTKDRLINIQFTTTTALNMIRLNLDKD